MNHYHKTLLFLSATLLVSAGCRREELESKHVATTSTRVATLLGLRTARNSRDVAVRKAQNSTYCRLLRGGSYHATISLPRNHTITIDMRRTKDKHTSYRRIHEFGGKKRTYECLATDRSDACARKLEETTDDLRHLVRIANQTCPGPDRFTDVTLVAQNTRTRRLSSEFTNADGSSFEMQLAPPENTDHVSSETEPQRPIRTYRNLNTLLKPHLESP